MFLGTHDGSQVTSKQRPPMPSGAFTLPKKLAGLDRQGNVDSQAYKLKCSESTSMVTTPSLPHLKGSQGRGKSGTHYQVLVRCVSTSDPYLGIISDTLVLNVDPQLWRSVLGAAQD